MLNLALTMNVELNMMLITVVLKLRVRAVGVVYFAVAFGAYVAVRCGSRRWIEGIGDSFKRLDFILGM